MARGEIEKDPFESRVGLSDAIKKTARDLGQPLLETIEAMLTLPSSTLEVLVGRKPGGEIIEFPRKQRGPTNSDPLPR